MPVSLDKPTDRFERLIADYVRRGLSDYVARQQYQDGRRWAENLSAEERARALTFPAVKRSPMTVYVLNEATTAQNSAH